MRLFMLLCALICFAATLAPQASSQVISPVAQDRQVSGNAYGLDTSGTDSQSNADNAPDFQAWTDGASGGINLSDVFASGGGTQVSSIEHDRLDLFGTCGGSAENYGFEGTEEAASGGLSRFDVTFDLNFDSDFALTGSVGSFDNGSIEITLSSASQTIYSYGDFGGGTASINELGTLPPGQYRLEVETSYSAYAFTGSNDYGSGEYDLELLFTPTTSSVPDQGVSVPVALHAQPNPFKNRVQLSSPQAWNQIDVFDIQGRRVHSLGAMPAGSTTFWDGETENGQAKAGVYFLRARGPQSTVNTKVILSP